MEIKEKIENTLKIEGNALLKLSDSISEEVCEAVLNFFYTKGRVIVTGIGKSAIVAQKIVATLNSTGTSSVFMHAADAIHGDLGMIGPEDIVLCISKSGDTPEIKVLVPLIKGFGNLLIAMVSNSTSYLAKNADHNIFIPVDNEADPNNLAPTTSTTLQMAMGDAIAIALLSLRGFSHNEFAKFHPGGSLGKQLYMKVADLSSQNEKPKVYENDSIRKVILEISSKRLGATAVVDDNENIKGIITDGDLRRMLEHKESDTYTKALDIMTPHPKHIQKTNLAIDALGMMRKYSITQLIVLNEN
ncbi:MAG: KpsF/GutQ family sugar-phosphate isomerase, partial [Saprospiraceae bacterium]|nr:KpsF/GutQ family sugar-phosphate isomerase [Saprospiraceae bacterium]